MLEASVEALQYIATPGYLGFLLLGVSLGLTIGLIPGLGGIVGMSMILPFIFGMDPVNGLALLTGAVAVGSTSDTFPAVLIGVPGSAGAQATIMDGYPLARQGRAKEALAAAFTASVLGGLFGAFALLAVLGVARPLLLQLRSPQLLMLTLLGLSLVGVLSQKAPGLGLLSALLGALLGVVGVAPVDGFPRYTFGTAYLTDGIPLAVLALGLFGMPEIINLLAKGSSVASQGRLEGSIAAGVRAALQHRWLILRSSVMGMAVGAVPGLGGAVVDWLVYGVAQQTYRDSENFGKGDIRGVIAPESANNAKEGGSFLPTLVFGIPGSGVMAVMIGGLTLLGLQVGPGMLERDLSFTISVAWTLALANVVGVLACFIFIRPIARLTTIRASRLMPFILVLVAMAAYQSSGRIGDIIALLVIGLLGWVLNHVGIPRPPMLIGFVLSVSAERYLFLTRGLYQWGFLREPSVIGLGLVIVVLTVGIPLVRRRNRV
ncbi:tripartite tricarboxylate transporter permease [Egicoccus halophilus]|uniref:DUF112 domain-containing protein n=1 Tax=Egicoccus halophilus TaxID=1670830 RepID=A0A8J3A6I0_9ACTN|nr:tripartite tricarboxylate transporter permease [Egicoccus halophilus]GGI02392.1 hypothetical protein GCM10011354_00200 [Egicoccus halophilus]